MTKSTLFSVTSLLTIALSSQVFAQSESEIHDEIIVTGEKIHRSLQNTPTSVAVITNLDIEQRNIINIRDVMQQTANVATTSGRTFTIRGINNENVSGAGLGDLATMYVDGAPMAREAVRSSPLDLWDIEQIEILRGPQSTLQGRNTLAGAIIVNTADPKYQFSGRMRAIIGSSAEEKRLGIAFGGPIVEDQIAFRLAAEFADSKGRVKNPTIGDYADARSSVYLRGKLLVEPKAIPDLSVMLSYTYDERNTGNLNQRLDGAGPFKKPEIFSNKPNFDNITIDMGVLNITYEISDALQISSISTKNIVNGVRGGDSDWTATPGEFFNFKSDSDIFTQELRLSFNQGNFSGIVGGFYSTTDRTPDVSSTQSFDVVNDLGLVQSLVHLFQLPVATANFIASFYSDPLIIEATAKNPISVETYAAFGDVTYDVSPSIRLFGGFRYDNEKQAITTGNSVSIISALPDPAVFPAQLAPIIAGVNGFLHQQAANATQQAVQLQSPTFGEFLPKAGISWDIADEKNISFIVQRGYRSGGVEINIARAETFQFNPEFIWNYELSWRSRWLDNALTLNANAFFIDWTDQQVDVQLSANTFDVITENAGKSEVKGFEVETMYHVNAALDLYGSIGYAHTEFKEFFATIGGVQVDLSGNAFRNAPEWTLNAGFTWENPQGFFVNANANYNSAKFIDRLVVQTDHDVSSRVFINTKAGWSNQQFGLFVTARNLLNEKHLSSFFSLNSSRAADNPEFGIYAEPRTISLQVEAKF